MLLGLLAVAFPPPSAGIPPKSALKPFIHSRTEWRAESAKRIPLDLAKSRIVVHHTANLVTSAVKAIGTNKASWKAAVTHVHQAQDLHKRVRGWSDVGYHYMIDWKDESSGRQSTSWRPYRKQSRQHRGRAAGDFRASGRHWSKSPA